jgi:hypothetical protein
MLLGERKKAKMDSIFGHFEEKKNPIFSRLVLAILLRECFSALFFAFMCSALLFSVEGGRMGCARVRYSVKRSGESLRSFVFTTRRIDDGEGGGEGVEGDGGGRRRRRRRGTEEKRGRKIFVA